MYVNIEILWVASSFFKKCFRNGIQSTHSLQTDHRPYPWIKSWARKSEKFLKVFSLRNKNNYLLVKNGSWQGHFFHVMQEGNSKLSRQDCHNKG